MRTPEHQRKKFSCFDARAAPSFLIHITRAWGTGLDLFNIFCSSIKSRMNSQAPNPTFTFCSGILQSEKICLKTFARASDLCPKSDKFQSVQVCLGCESINKSFLSKEQAKERAGKQCSGQKMLRQTMLWQKNIRAMMLGLYKKSERQKFKKNFW